MPIELSHEHVAIRAVDYAATIDWYGREAHPGGRDLT